MSEATTTVEAPQRRLFLQRVPWRVIILIGLSAILLVGIVLGTAATLQQGRFSGADWTRLAVGGVTRGSVYAIIAVGYTLVYGILFLINFAHGEVFMAGAFTSFFVARPMAQNGFLDSNPILALGLLLVVSICVSALTAVLLERIAYRPLRGAPRLIPLITAIGASLFLQNTFRGLFGAQARGYPVPDVLGGKWTIIGIPILKTQAVAILGAALLVVALYALIAKTRT